MGTNNNIEFIRGILHERTKYRDVEANFLALLAACTDLDLSLEAIRKSPVKTGAEIRAVIERLAREGRLGVRSEFTEAFRKFWSAHPELQLCDAGRGLLESLCDQEGDVSFDVLEYLLGQPGVREQLPVDSKYLEEQARANAEVTEALAIREELLGLFGNRKFQYKNAHPSLWQKELAKENTRLGSMDLNQLRQEMATRREKIRLSNLDKESLRAEVRKSVTQNNQQLYADRFPTLPPEIYLRGSFQKVVLNRENLIRIANTDREWFRQLCGKYGDAAINQRMQEGI